MNLDEDDDTDDEPVDVSGDESDGDDAAESAGDGLRGDPASRRKLFEDDPDAALFQAFGATAEELGVDNADYVEVRRAKKRIRDREAKILGVAEKIEPLALLATAYREGDYAKFAELIEGLTGEAYETANLRMMRALPHPGDAKKDKVIAELKGKLAPPPEEDPMVVAVRTEVRKNHPVRNIDDWEGKVAALLTETADSDGDPTLSASAAAQAVYEAEEKDLAQRAAKLQIKISDTKPRARAASGARKRKLSLEDIVADLNKERD